MKILEDGHFGADDFPEGTPELPPAPKKGQFRWTSPPDALSREQYLAIGRPMLVAAGFLKPESATEKPTLPPMPNSGARKRAPKPKAAPPDEAPF